MGTNILVPLKREKKKKKKIMRGRNATFMIISWSSSFLGGLVCGGADHLDTRTDNKVT